MSSSAPPAPGHDVVELTYGRGNSTCRISVYAAHVLSWKVDGVEQLFMSSKAAIGIPGKAARGGVPICWPQFGNFDDVARGAPRSKHGLVRKSSLWRVASRAKDGSAATMVLEPDAAMLAAWPGGAKGFRVAYTVALGEKSLRFTFAVTNKGDAPLEFTGCLHTYYRCEDVTRCAVTGLAGTKVDKKPAGIGKAFEGREVEARAKVGFEGETEALYGGRGTTDVVFLEEAGTPRLKLSKSSNFPDWVIWNIGADKAGGMADLGDGEWRNYVCIEPVVASAPATVGPGRTWLGFHEVEVV